MPPCLSPAPARFSHFFLLNDFSPISRCLEQANLIDAWSEKIQRFILLTEHVHDKNDPMGLIQEDPELFVRPKLDDGKQKSFLPGGAGGLPESECRA